MHGLICRGFEDFLVTTHGGATWDAVRQEAGLPQVSFEALLSYRDGDFMALQRAASGVLDMAVASLMEDLGTWICTHPPLAPVRRLFRFSGPTFRALIASLDEVDARARMALPDLTLPALRVQADGPDRHWVDTFWNIPGAAGVLMGVLRVMADEYGTLVMIEPGEVSAVPGGWREVVRVHIADTGFAAPTGFALAEAAG
jgi:hypothetical protein